MAKLPESAKVVIIGQGGIVGSSVAHHLIERGWDNIVGIDKSAIPTDIGSTSHASDFCFMTAHDKLTCWTAWYSMEFFEKIGHYSKVGGLEVARHDDNERMEELKRKVASGKAFGTNVDLISAKEAKEKFPPLEEDMIQGAMWDPDAGLVIPRSQIVSGELVKWAQQSGKLQTFGNTPATGLETQNGRIVGVHTDKGYIKADVVICCAGLWGRKIAEMAGEDLPVMPVEHPLLWFGPFNEFDGTGKEIGYPLLRDQGNSGYMRDTGDSATTEGGQFEWGYYEEKQPRMVHPDNILEKEQARLSPSQRDLELEQVEAPLERGMELVPMLGDMGLDEKTSFNGLLQVTADGGPSIGESPKVRGLWYGVSVWIKDGPGTGKLIADWITDGQTHLDHHGIDFTRYYPFQKTKTYIHDRCYETAFKIYNPPVHNREPYTAGRNIRRGPFWPREKELGGYFMEIGGWERAHGYKANEAKLLEKWGKHVPERKAEWDARHFWHVSNAEHLELSDNVGMINLSHFASYDVTGPDAEKLMEYTCVAKVGGNTAIGKGIYTHFLDHLGGVRADLTVLRLGERHWRVVDGADAGNRDYVWLSRMAEKHGWDVDIQDTTTAWSCIGLWGPNARKTLQAVADEPDQLTKENFGFAKIKDITVKGLPVTAFRISYVGEQGWELHIPQAYGLSVWDTLYEQGVTPVGIEMYASSRRLEKGMRLQNADLLTEYNLVEADLQRPKVKDADFHGKQAHIKQRERQHQPAYLCTMTVQNNVDKSGTPRYMVGNSPIKDAKTGEVLIDSAGRRSYTTSVAYGPSVGANICMGYIPYAYCTEGRELLIEYFYEDFPVKIESVGNKPLFDPGNDRLKT